MSKNASLIVEVIDTKNRHIENVADVRLSHTVLSDPRYGCTLGAHKKRCVFKEIDASQGGRYKLTVFPLCYRPVSQFVSFNGGESKHLRIQVPVNPECVSAVTFPQFDELPDILQRCLDRSSVDAGSIPSGRELYEALGQLQKAGLLNIFTKMNATRFSNQASAFSYVRSLIEVRGARIFANVDSELWSQVQTGLSSGQFDKVSGRLHEVRPGHTMTGSFKTDDNVGNLQLTFSKHVENGNYIVDADIDDARGLAHLFQVLNNHLRNQDSHPYDIREILLSSQLLDPGYDFRMREEKV
ncbi:MAG: hypothetical protein EBZ36_05615 [Acidobacteria bacterium]|nr:hypothetical protein [Acidobacteriota bacterium]